MISLCRRTVLLLAVCLLSVLALDSCSSEPNSWINLKPSGSEPSARFGQAMVYASIPGKIIMFGGATDEESPLNDTWIYDRGKNAWTELEPSGTLPPARRSMAAAYCPGENNVVIFGGLGADGEVLGDTRVYDVSENTWTPWIAPTPSSPPSARNGAKMAYDPESGRLLLFGGTYLRASASASFQHHFSDTWAFGLSTATWTNLGPSGTVPSPGDEGRVSMVYNEAIGKMLLLAGLPPVPDVPTTGHPYEDWLVWNYETLSNSWSENPPAPESPSVSRYYALAYDRVSRNIVLFGGTNPQDETQDDTWIYEPAANTWSRVLTGGSDSPPERIDSGLVYDQESRTMILFGCRSGEGRGAEVFNDTWEYMP